MAGRPTKQTPKLEEAILRALRAGSTRSAAAEYVGVDRTQIWRWMQRDTTFRNAVIRAEAEAEVAYTGILRQAAPNDWRAAFSWLERRRYKDWGKVDRVELTIRERAAEMAEADGLDAAELIRLAEDLVSAK